MLPVLLLNQDVTKHFPSLKKEAPGSYAQMLSRLFREKEKIFLRCRITINFVI